MTMTNQSHGALGGQRPAKWIKFIGFKTEHWKKILDQISIEKIPFDFVDELRFHFNSGKTYVHSTVNLNEKKIEDLIEKVIESNQDLTAIEFVVDVDKIHSEAMSKVRQFIEGSKE